MFTKALQGQGILNNPPNTACSRKRAFSLAEPHYRNDLPLSIITAPLLTVFKTSLKTHLFKTGINKLNIIGLDPAQNTSLKQMHIVSC